MTRLTMREESGGMPNPTAKVVLLEAGEPCFGAILGAGADNSSDLGDFTVERIAWTMKGAETRLPASADVLMVSLSTEGERDAGSMLDWLEARRPALPVLGLLPSNLPPDLTRRAALIVDDFLFSPVRGSEIRTRLWRLASATPKGAQAVARRLSRDIGLRALVGHDPAFQRLVNGIPRIAASDATVLITGETGTGKELYARALHHLGPRRDRPFVAVDCGAFPEQLLENELFGHAAGAFTDARSDHKGLAGMAEGGVLFLDEVDALSLPSQGKLLRFLQERTFKPLGDQRFHQADLRIVAATNRDLQALVKEFRFRADLFFRLSVLPIHVMPLRERRADIPLLAAHFLARCGAGGTGRLRRFTPAALALLGGQDFLGNVRELHNLVQRAAVMIEADDIDAPELASLLSGCEPPCRERATSIIFRDAKARAIEEFERAFVATLLQKHSGNVTRASREAGKDRRAFGRLAKKYGL